LWVNPLVALRSFFVCARKLAQKYTSLPARTAQEREALQGEAAGLAGVPRTTLSADLLEEAADLARDGL
jgi:hypothetical protein